MFAEVDAPCDAERPSGADACAFPSPRLLLRASFPPMEALPRSAALAPARYESLDAWRGVACLAVVVVHAASHLHLTQVPAAAGMSIVERLTRTILAWGWAGVPMFFVISGYCIAAAAHAGRARGDRPGEFFQRRFRRIFPPYWCCLAISAVVITLLGAIEARLGVAPRHDPVIPATITPVHWIGNLTLTETWLGHLTGAPFEWRNMVVGQAWTLCYEEQFYAVVGLLLFVAGPRFARVLAAVTALILARWLLQSPNINSGFFFDGRWILFAAGLAVWFDIACPRGATRWLTRGFLVVGLAWALRDPGVFLVRSQGVEHEWLVSFAFAAMLLLLHRFDGAIASHPLARPLAARGTRCYSIYLVHMLAVRPITLAFRWAGWTSLGLSLVVTIPLCVGGSLGAGWLFHRFVERRFLNAHPPGRRGAAAGAAPQPRPQAAPAIDLRRAA